MKRHCPIKEKEDQVLPIIRNNEPGCLPACSITAGFGGAGAITSTVNSILPAELAAG